MVEVIGKAVFAHTGCASASTLARTFGGRSAGVSTSTRTPSSVSSSSCKPPRWNRGAPGSASTSKSRSLPSRSVPCSTEPKTRGGAARKRLFASYQAQRKVVWMSFFIETSRDAKRSSLEFQAVVGCKGESPTCARKDIAP